MIKTLFYPTSSIVLSVGFQREAFYQSRSWTGRTPQSNWIGASYSWDQNHHSSIMISNNFCSRFYPHMLRDFKWELLDDRSLRAFSYEVLEDYAGEEILKRLGLTRPKIHPETSERLP